MNFRKLLRPLILSSLAFSCGGPQENPAELKEVGNAPQRVIPVVTIFAEMPVGNMVEGINYVATPFAHDQAYFYDLVFGAGIPATINGKSVRRSVNDYVQKASNGKLSLKSVGYYHIPWMVDKVSKPQTDQERITWNLRKLEEHGFDFRPYDTNKNGQIEANELTVMTFANFTRSGGTTRWPGPCVPLSKAPLTYCSSTTFIDSYNNFATVTHEFLHTLGTVDLYGFITSTGENARGGLTLMGPTIRSDGEDMESIQLDAYHLEMLGWNAPKVLPYSTHSTSITLDSLPSRTIAKIVNPNKASESYLIEYRSKNTLYDDGIFETGVAIWHIDLSLPGDDANRIHTVGPNGRRASANYFPGSAAAWQAVDGLIQLQWNDGSFLPWDISIGSVDPATASALASKGGEAVTLNFQKRAILTEGQGLFPDSNWQALFHGRVQGACPYGGDFSGDAFCTLRNLPMKPGQYYEISSSNSILGLFYAATNGTCPEGGRPYGNQCLVYAFLGYSQIQNLPGTVRADLKYTVTESGNVGVVSYPKTNGSCSTGTPSGNTCFVGQFNLPFGSANTMVKYDKVGYAPVNRLCYAGGVYDGTICVVAKFEKLIPGRLPRPGL